MKLIFMDFDKTIINYDSIDKFLYETQNNIIKIFANFLSVDKENMAKYIRPMFIYRKLCKNDFNSNEPICKKELKEHIVNFYKNKMKIHKPKTIFIGNNYTKSDYELAISCDLIFTKSRSLLAKKLKNNNINYNEYMNFEEIKEKLIY